MYYKDAFSKKGSGSLSRPKMKEYCEECLGVLQYFRNMEPPSWNLVQYKVKKLPKKDRDCLKRRTLVLDLDETLVHYVEDMSRQHDVIVDVIDPLTGEC